MKRNFSFFAILTTIITFVGCSSNYDKGIKLINDNKFKDAIEEFSKIKPEESKYQESEEMIQNCYYKIGLEFIRNNEMDSAISYLDKIKSKYPVYSKSVSAIKYCDAVKSLSNSNKKKAGDLFSQVIQECELYSDAQNKIKELDIESKKKIEDSNEIKTYKNYMVFNEYLINIQDCGNKSYNVRIKDRNTEKLLYKSEILSYFTPGKLYPSDLNDDGIKELIAYGFSGGNGGFYNIMIFDFKYGVAPVAKFESVGFNPTKDIYKINSRTGIKVHYRKITTGLSMSQTPVLYYTIFYDNGKITKKD